MLGLNQGPPGQLGLVSRRTTEAGVTITVQYGDHDHNLILIVPPSQHEQAQAVATKWTAGRR